MLGHRGTPSSEGPLPVAPSESKVKPTSRKRRCEVSPKNELGCALGACRGGSFGDQPFHPVGRLRAFGDPVLNPVLLEVDACRVCAGIIRPNHFHETAVARPL